MVRDYPGRNKKNGRAGEGEDPPRIWTSRHDSGYTPLKEIYLFFYACECLPTYMNVYYVVPLEARGALVSDTRTRIIAHSELPC